MAVRISSGVDPHIRSKKEYVKKEEMVRSQLQDLQAKSNRKLYQIRTVFPFDFFPDTIIIDDHKVDIVYGIFFFTKTVFPVFYRDIRTVTVHTGLFFGEIEFEIIGFEKNPPIVRKLWRSDAIRVRRMILGMIAAIRQNIDVSQLSVSELRKKIEDIGSAADTTAGVV